MLLTSKIHSLVGISCEPMMNLVSEIGTRKQPRLALLNAPTRAFVSVEAHVRFSLSVDPSSDTLLITLSISTVTCNNGNVPPAPPAAIGDCENLASILRTLHETVGASMRRWSDRPTVCLLITITRADIRSRHRFPESDHYSLFYLFNCLWKYPD